MFKTFKIGDTYHIYKNICGNLVPTKIHILAIIEDQIVFKYYSYNFKTWKYEIIYPSILTIEIERYKERAI